MTLRKWIVGIDFAISIFLLFWFFTRGHFFWALEALRWKNYPLLQQFPLKSGLFESIFLIKNSDSNIYNVLFLYTLIKIVISIVMLLKLKKKFLNIKIMNLIPCLIFSILIILFSIILVKNNINGGLETLIYSLLFCLGTFIWINCLLYNVELNGILKNIYCMVTSISNYLILIIIYIYWHITF